MLTTEKRHAKTVAHGPPSIGWPLPFAIYRTALNNAV
jgi:hypothetical protein